MVGCYGESVRSRLGQQHQPDRLAERACQYVPRTHRRDHQIEPCDAGGYCGEVPAERQRANAGAGLCAKAAPASAIQT